MENTQLPMPAKAPHGINGKMRAAHVGLRTTDYAGTLNWYTEKLGFRIVKEWTVGNLQLAFLALANDDNLWLEVVCEETLDSAPKPPRPITSGFHHLCLEVDNVEETLSALREKEVQVIREPFYVPAIGKRCGFITDLHGNIIEFAENIN
ncbi:VOC family protein [Hymenobacter sediminis]|uniref:VOC family protein n=1 Tax=Hymenobacter sediminis TaxID=2218621 RepID=UPI000DA64BF0|nr:VOC family protein [Hymenobacter sediminis]RPD48716.1 VOC family protein [Hymenobacter sediminis]